MWRAGDERSRLEDTSTSEWICDKQGEQSATAQTMTFKRGGEVVLRSEARLFMKHHEPRIAIQKTSTKHDSTAAAAQVDLVK